MTDPTQLPDSEQAVAEEGQDALAFLRAGRAEAELVNRLTSAVKVSRIHALENVVAQEALHSATDALGAYLDRRERAEILLNQRRVYVNGRLVRSGTSGHSFLDDMIDFMSRMGVGGILFGGSWSVDSVRLMLNAFKRVGQDGTPESRVQTLAREFDNFEDASAQVTVLDPEQAEAYVQEEEEGYLSETERAAYYYARLVGLAEASHRSLERSGSPDFHSRHLRQTLMKVIDRLESRLFELRVAGLTALAPMADVPLASHVTNVAILSVLMGRLLGLPRGVLADLAFAAVHHDMGRVGHDYRVDPGDPTREDPRTAELHVVRGMELGLRGRSYGSAGLLRLVVSQEHHRLTDSYPEAIALREPHLFSQIVGIADAFDRLQNGSAFQQGVPPRAALARLQADPERYDPHVVRLLVDVLGRYPRGTVLRLWDGSVGVVVDGGASRGHRPVVRRLLKADQTEDSERTLIELTDPEDNAKVLDPNEVFVDWRTTVVE